MKKRPPPGATLIARLKERRLQREQAEDMSPPQDSSILDVEPEVADSSAPTGDNLEIDLDAGRQVPGDLLHRELSIDDLRPSTSDYEALTEEIRLAGRFAAVGLIAQGLRLARMHSDELHKEHYSTFEEYCRKEHQMSATYAYRLIRMAEMAERVAIRRLQADERSLPDPFEAMLHLGHRHLMALLPLEPDRAEELLVKGVPVSDSDGGEDRVPIDRATEKQIRAAFRAKGARPAETQPRFSGRDLVRLQRLLEDFAIWLESVDPQARMEKDPQPLMGIRDAAERVAQALSELDDEQ